ncbi:M56 family metallopeptidase [Parafrankia sp. EUN1f]|uniref:M56 family metallopeptidase n=1 Tax=Parafrankia sp. EUN1f TaxID=102897 RepID=UPI0001C43D74|nr:M56 family metallopeptidase [Parafrankia sp. EUN1f]EFC86128.1 peptidase M48 Ste24p [Parafrankia sp. EUN1f]
MSLALLVVYVTVVGVLLPRQLSQAGWTSHAPRLAAGTWLVAAASVLSVALLAAAVLVTSLHTLGDAFVLLLQGCGWPPQLRAPAGSSDYAGLVIIGWIVSRTVHSGYLVCRAARRERRQHRCDLRLLGEPAGTGVVVLDHPRPSAFCVPGDGGHIVLTRGALDVLSPAELAAVLAHERAHLSGRHHVIVLLPAILATAFPRMPLFTLALSEVRRLVELAADDKALRRATPATLAQAVLRLAVPASAQHPVTSPLNATGTATTERVLRLVTPRPRRTRLAMLSRLLVAVSFAATPLAAVALPAATDLASHCTEATTSRHLADVGLE